MWGSLLSIVPDSAGTDPQQFTIVYQAGEKRLSTTAHIARLLAPEEEESIRWYLEEYRKFPFEPALTIAKNAAERLKKLGEQLFDQLFNATDEARDLWTLAEEQLDTTRIEIAANPAGFAVPWEILWNPLDVMPVVCRAASFVRAGFAPAAPVSPNAPGAIRILLVISRPAGNLDAPFLSVAARLLDRVDGDPRFRFEVLRPPTFEAFQLALRSAAEQGQPYSVVHFDGHGVHEDLSARRENRPARRRRGYLLFETPFEPNRPDYINAPALGEALAAGGSPILILNACRSARAEIWSEQMGNLRPLGSLADELMRLGQPAVLAMQYNVEVETASRFIADLYQGLADRGSLSEAVQDGRRNLFGDSTRAGADHHLKIHDWVVPVLFEAFPHSLGLDQRPLLHQRRHSHKPANASIGADDTLMAIERAFQIAPVVVLSGPVGSGKTRLAAEFAGWDARTRDEANRARSPLHLRDAAAEDTAQLVATGARVIIETRDANFSPAQEHVVVRMNALDLPERIALMRRQLPAGIAFDPDPWQPVLAFSQGNPAVLLNLAAMAVSAPAGPATILETARTQPVGLDPSAFVPALSTFDPEDMDCLAIAALFEGPVSSRTLRTVASAGSHPREQDADSVFNCLTALGLATPLGSSYYQIHPGLPGLLRPEFERRYPGVRGERVRATSVTLISAICAIFYRHGDSGERDAYERQSQTLGLIEPTIRRVLDYAIAAGSWSDARNLSAALRRVLTQQGRRPEWRWLADHLQTLVPEDANGNPPPGRESLWYLIHQDRIEDLVRIHSLAEAVWLQERSLRQVRSEFTHFESAGADEFAREVLIPQLRRMGDIRKEQRQPDAVRHYSEALQIAQRLQATIHEQRIAAQLADFYLSQEPIDWGGGELSYWLTYASELCPPHDRIGQAQLTILRGGIALARSQPAEAAEHFHVALTGLLPADPSDERAECELKLGQALFEHRASLPESMQHVQTAIAWYDKDQNVFRASCARLAASHILSESGESSRAFFYAGEAARGFASLAPHAEKEALEASRFEAGLDNHERSREEVA
jgi:tetratricopeptide (TPR) repeat protein